MTAAAWDALHRDPRHRLEYPSEHVVRWLAGLERVDDFPLALDIGCGGGRHLAVMEKFGYSAVGCDPSTGRLDGSTQITRGDMRSLPFRSDSFALALAYGVFYYGTRADHEQAVAEMHRVLRPGGKAFVSVRTTYDWRFANTRRVNATTFALDLPGEPEHGMALDFLTEYEARTMYGRFSQVSLELTETTTRGGTRCDSDWLISLTK